VHKNVNQETPHKNATTRNKTKVETPKFEWFGVSYIQKQTLCVWLWTPRVISLYVNERRNRWA